MHRAALFWVQNEHLSQQVGKIVRVITRQFSVVYQDVGFEVLFKRPGFEL
jgi:hypothetical protein